MRIAAAHFPSLGIEIVRQREGVSGPLAIVWAKPGGAVEREVDVIGGSRIGACCREAYAHGVRVGMTVAAARAKIASLSVRVVFLAEIEATLVRLSEMALQWGPTVSMRVDEQVVLVDVTGSAHLFKPEGEDILEGERAILDAWQRMLLAMNHEAALVVAEGPTIAELIARFGQWQRRYSRPLVVPPLRTREAVGRLPVHALPIDESDHEWLRTVGLMRFADLRAQPPEGLGLRLRNKGPLVLRLIEGEDHSALKPFVPEEVPQESVHLEYATSGVEPLLFIVKALCDRIGARLQGRQERAGRLELELSLDCGLRNKKRQLFITQLPEPLNKSNELFAVLRTKLESAQLDAPTEKVTLRAHERVRAHAVMGHLFERESKSDQALSRLLAELAADIGTSHVGTLGVRDTWVAENRSVLMPALLSQKPRPASLAQVEPVRMVTEVIAIERASLSNLRRQQRFEWVEWWKRGRGGTDWVSAWSAELGATVMVELGAGGVSLRGILD